MPEKRYKWRREDYREKTHGLLMVNTGDGKGKTTAALGVLVRAAGRGLKCCLIQFMKSKNDRYGEHDALEKLGVESIRWATDLPGTQMTPRRYQNKRRDMGDVCRENAKRRLRTVGLRRTRVCARLQVSRCK
jgi:cob(I)alamin adenosyltransferase